MRVTDGESIASPAATRRTALTISAGGVSLSRNPSAPARSALITCSSAWNVVSTITCGGCVEPAQRGGRGDAVHLGHPDVHQHDVGSVLADRGDGAGAVVRLAHHLQVLGRRTGSSAARRAPARRRRPAAPGPSPRQLGVHHEVARPVRAVHQGAAGQGDPLLQPEQAGAGTRQRRSGVRVDGQAVANADVQAAARPHR